MRRPPGPCRTPVNCRCSTRWHRSRPAQLTASPMPPRLAKDLPDAAPGRLRVVDGRIDQMPRRRGTSLAAYTPLIRKRPEAGLLVDSRRNARLSGTERHAITTPSHSPGGAPNGMTVAPGWLRGSFTVAAGGCRRSSRVDDVMDELGCRALVEGGVDAVTEQVGFGVGEGAVDGAEHEADEQVALAGCDAEPLPSGGR
jgi:hypothetical protein